MSKNKPPKSSSPTMKRSPGRPRDNALREKILEVAKAMFIEHGANVSLEKIAEAAGTTKMTLYSHFPSKEVLINAALTQPFTSAQIFDEAMLDPADPARSLLDVATVYVELATSESMVAQILTLYQAAGKDHALAKAVYDSGPAAMIERLAEYLRGVSALRIEDPVFAAEQFLSLVRGMEQTRSLLALAPARRGRARKAYLESCVTMFLRGHSR
ncbi:MAG: TetR/AcrR family transcriptional regulator [Ramlibacter sp.]